MKKIIAIVLSVFLAAVSAPFAISALNVYEKSNMIIIFESDSAFSEREKEIICAKLRGISSGGGESPDNIICDIFGHSYTEELVTAITHKLYPTQPRCREETYKVKVCSRCSDTQTELISFAYIVCCQ